MELTPPETDSQFGNFGNPIKISGDASTIVVGDPNYSLPASSAGRVYVYKTTPEGQLTLQSPEFLGAGSFSGLGNSIAVSTQGNVILAGQSLANGNEGSVRFFEETDNPVSIRNALELPGLTVFPATQSVVVNFGQDLGPAKVTSRIYDLNGRLLGSREDPGGSGYTWRIRLPRGGYVLQLISGGKALGQTFLK